MMRPAALLAALLVVAQPLAAAPAPLPPEKPAGVDAPAAQPAPQDTLPPYEADVERLAGLMGTLSFMRDLCGAADGAEWRTKMQDLLAAEGTTPVRRDRLAGAFNEGLQGYAATYRRCTPAASLVIGRALDEAARLIADLARRYGG